MSKIYVVGIGPGAYDQMTGRAIRALNESDVIIGYTVYVDLVKEYFAGKASTHLVGILGGCIWGLGTALSYIAAEKAGAAISYALGQGAPMIAALWGVFIWKEFTGSSKSTDRLLGIMFILFITGLSFIVLSGGN